MKQNLTLLIGTILVGSAPLLAWANDASPQSSLSAQDVHSALQPRSHMQGEQISLDKVPEAAKQKIMQHSGGANPKDVRMLTLNGQKFYTATFEQGRTNGKLTVGADGKLVSLRESTVLSPDIDLSKSEKSQINMDQLPQPVQDKIRQEAGSSRIGNLSKTDADGQLLYRVDFDRNGIRNEVFISPQGAIAARVQESTVASKWTFDENGNVVANPNRVINEAAGAQGPTQYHEQE